MTKHVYPDVLAGMAAAVGVDLSDGRFEVRKAVGNTEVVFSGANGIKTGSVRLDGDIVLLPYAGENPRWQVKLADRMVMVNTTAELVQALPDTYQPLVKHMLGMAPEAMPMAAGHAAAATPAYA